MANIKSAIKRVQIAERNRLQNKSYKSAVKTLTKRYLSAVNDYAADPSPALMQEVQSSMASVYSKIDKAVKRGVIHPNTGARKKSRLARTLKQYESKPSTDASKGDSKVDAPKSVADDEPMSADES